MYTTTCFGPICGPSSACDLTYRAAIQDVWGCTFRVLGIGWGERDLVVSWPRAVMTRLTVPFRNFENAPKKKGKAAPVNTVKIYRDSRRTAPLTLTIGTRWSWVGNMTSRLLYPSERTLVPTGGWVGPCSGLDVSEKQKSLIPAADRPVHSLSAHCPYVLPLYNVL